MKELFLALNTHDSFMVDSANLHCTFCCGWIQWIWEFISSFVSLFFICLFGPLTLGAFGNLAIQHQKYHLRKSWAFAKRAPLACYGVEFCSLTLSTWLLQRLDAYGSFGDKAGNIALPVCYVFTGFLMESRRYLRSNIKMSPQKAGAILHWFSARYGDNSPLPCHHARKKQCTEVKCWTWSCAVSSIWTLWR